MSFVFVSLHTFSGFTAASQTSVIADTTFPSLSTGGENRGQACRQGMNAASSPTSIMTMTEKRDGGAEFPAPLFLHRQK